MIPLPTRSLHIGQSGMAGGCADFFAALDKRIEQAGVLDSGLFRVKDFPYLRVDRLLASFRDEVDENAAFAGWVGRMQAMDQDARKFEIANLPHSAVVSLDPVEGKTGLYAKVAACGDRLKAVDLQTAEMRKRLVDSVSAPDDYIPLRRVFGLYPLTSLFVSHAVSKWHAEVQKTFSTEAPVGWRTIRYFPADSPGGSGAGRIVKPTRRDTLGIPVYSLRERETLFRLWAPFWEIQFKGDFDRIGAPVWNGNGVLEVDTDQPLTYTLLSFTRFGKEVLTQLNYIIWFPSRPSEGALDIYAGLFDGLNYRVTLDSNGKAILYETMHNCGCYYKAYPTERLQALTKINYAEPPLILKAPDIDPSKSYMTLAMLSGTHYVQHLYPATHEPQTAETAYSFADYNQLRTLPYAEDDRRSMFSQKSIVPTSERSERFILWTTGVLSSGAMRQWGRHAVAFVGKRHFDDPFYMERMFKQADAKGIR